MIHDYSRAHWFGASDSRYIFQEIPNKSWDDWWQVKCGRAEQRFKGNLYTKAGNTFEHSILSAYDPSIRFDRQIVIPSLRLRVNLDGNTSDHIYEVKTYQIGKDFKVHDGYFYQAQLQILAWEMEVYVDWIDVAGAPGQKKVNPKCAHTILAYGLYPDEYYGDYTEEQIENGLIPIDLNRIKAIHVGRSRSAQRQGKKILTKLAKRLNEEEVCKYL